MRGFARAAPTFAEKRCAIFAPGLSRTLGAPPRLHSARAYAPRYVSGFLSDNSRACLRCSELRTSSPTSKLRTIFSHGQKCHTQRAISASIKSTCVRTNDETKRLRISHESPRSIWNFLFQQHLAGWEGRGYGGFPLGCKFSSLRRLSLSRLSRDSRSEISSPVFTGEREASRFRSEKGKFKASYESGNNVSERQEWQGTGTDGAKGAADRARAR